MGRHDEPRHVWGDKSKEQMALELERRRKKRPKQKQYIAAAQKIMNTSPNGMVLQDLSMELMNMAGQMRRIADKMDSVPEQDCINQNCQYYNVMYDQNCQGATDELDNPLSEECEGYYSALSWHAQELRRAAFQVDTWIAGVKFDHEYHCPQCNRRSYPDYGRCAFCGLNGQALD